MSALSLRPLPNYVCFFVVCLGLRVQGLSAIRDIIAAIAELYLFLLCVMACVCMRSVRDIIAAIAELCLFLLCVWACACKVCPRYHCGHCRVMFFFLCVMCYGLRVHAVRDIIAAISVGSVRLTHYHVHASDCIENC
jgi:uncharacterized membrane protein YpjA